MRSQCCSSWSSNSLSTVWLKCRPSGTSPFCSKDHRISCLTTAIIDLPVLSLLRICCGVAPLFPCLALPFFLGLGVLFLNFFGSSFFLLSPLSLGGPWAAVEVLPGSLVLWELS